MDIHLHGAAFAGGMIEGKERPGAPGANGQKN